MNTNEVQGAAGIPDIQTIMRSRVHYGTDFLFLSFLQHHHNHLKRQAVSAPIPWRQIYTQHGNLLRRGVVVMPRQPSPFEPFVVSRVWIASTYLTKRAAFLSTVCPWPGPKIGRADDMYDCLMLMRSLQDFLSQELRYGFHKHCSIRSTRIPSCGS